jgi:hypothetical protein
MQQSAPWVRTNRENGFIPHRRVPLHACPLVTSFCLKTACSLQAAPGEDHFAAPAGLRTRPPKRGLIQRRPPRTLRNGPLPGLYSWKWRCDECSAPATGGSLVCHAARHVASVCSNVCVIAEAIANAWYSRIVIADALTDAYSHVRVTAQSCTNACCTSTVIEDTSTSACTRVRVIADALPSVCDNVDVLCRSVFLCFGFVCAA